MLTLIGTPRSRALRVMWMLEELGEEYQLVPAPPHSEPVLTANPSGKIPAVVTDEGETLIDSVAIVTWLADSRGRFTAPAGTIARAKQDGVTQFVVDEIEGALWTAGKHSFILPEERRVPQVKETARYEFGKAMETLERWLGDGRTFATGEDFTVPDVLLGHATGWARVAKFELPGGRVGDYFQRLRERPAFKRTMERAAAAHA